MTHEISAATESRLVRFAVVAAAGAVLLHGDTAPVEPLTAEQAAVIITTEQYTCDITSFEDTHAQPNRKESDDGAPRDQLHMQLGLTPDYLTIAKAESTRKANHNILSWNAPGIGAFVAEPDWQGHSEPGIGVGGTNYHIGESDKTSPTKDNLTPRTTIYPRDSNTTGAAVDVYIATDAFILDAANPNDTPTETTGFTYCGTVVHDAQGEKQWHLTPARQNVPSTYSTKALK